MITGQDVHDNLPFSNASFVTEARTLKALTVAVNQSWPALKLRRYVPNAGTLSSGVYTYALSSLTDIEPQLGVARVYIQESTTAPPVIHRGIRQQHDYTAGQWELVFPASLAERFAGSAFDVEYQTRHPAISALSDTLYITMEYAIVAVGMWYAQYALAQESVDRMYWRDIMQLYVEMSQQALRAMRTPALPRSVAVRTKEGPA